MPKRYGVLYVNLQRRANAEDWTPNDQGILETTSFSVAEHVTLDHWRWKSCHLCVCTVKGFGQRIGNFYVKPLEENAFERRSVG